MESALSTEIVLDVILSYLNENDLLNCRKVSKLWNKAASSALRRSSMLMNNISDETDLMKLKECMEQSSDFPFSGLLLDQPWKMNSAGAMEFFNNYGACFTRLSLDAPWGVRLQDLVPFITHLPRLSLLEVGKPGSRLPREFLDSVAGQEHHPSILNLPSLRTLRISYQTNGKYIGEVYTAASPLLQMGCPDATYGILRSLKSAGKLQTVSAMTFYADNDEEHDPLRVDKLLSSESPTLTTLYCTAGGCISSKGLIKLLSSSQHTLKLLCLVGFHPSQFSSKCPVLTKLTTLSLCTAGLPFEYVFQGRHGHKFPALKQLELYSPKGRMIAKLSDGLFIVPSLKTIHLDGRVDKTRIQDLARGFPNVTEIRLYDSFDDEGWSWEGHQIDIWSVGTFNCLEKLTIWGYTIKRPSKNYMNMDRFLTGIPIAICKNLRKNSQQNLIDSPFHENLRKSPCILQLKNLKELVVCVKLEHGLEELPEEPPFMSMVSLWYALEMMPNLQARFVFEHTSPSWSFEEKNRDKAVTMLKAAFKHVQPYVALEPFFY